MTEIPDDIMKASNECVAQFRWNNDNRWHLFVARAIQAERERPVPEGWKLVPIEPTPAMDSAGYDTVPSDMTIKTGVDHLDIWRAMLAASPAPPSPKPAAMSEGGEDE